MVRERLSLRRRFERREVLIGICWPKGATDCPRCKLSLHRALSCEGDASEHSEDDDTEGA